MGNDLCTAANQSQFKLRCRQVCNGVQDIDKNRKLQPITFSQSGSPRSKNYHDDDRINQPSSIQKFDQTKQQIRQLYKNSEFISTQQFDPIKQSQVKVNVNQYQDNKQNFQNLHQPGSPTKKVKLDLNKIHLKQVNSNQYLGNQNYQPISVPFSVIKMTLNKKLIDIIRNDDQNFFNKFQKDITSFKLFKSGCYGNILTQNYGIFLNHDYFYQGGFQENQKDGILPAEKGTFITEAGKYKGQFKDGKPNGLGKYYEFNQSLTLSRETILSEYSKSETNKSAVRTPIHKSSLFVTVYEGQWSNGSLTSGTIQNNHLKYEGKLKNRKPHGFGKLYLKQSKVSYKGQFVNGRFQGHNSVYETSQYTYTGDFSNGKKEGEGALLQKLIKLKNSKGQMRFEQRYEGIWKQDKLLNLEDISIIKA